MILDKIGANTDRSKHFERPCAATFDLRIKVLKDFILFQLTSESFNQI